MAGTQKSEPLQPGEGTEGKVESQEAGASSGSAFESIYDRLPNISIKALDWFIAACIVALVAVVLMGVLKARHII